mgnify:CR=1 FL=1
MSSSNTASDELRERVTDYCNHFRNIPDIESVKNLLTKVSEDQRYELLSSITDSAGDEVLTVAAWRGHTELCVTLLSSIPPADRRKLILVNKDTALHWAAYRGCTDTVLGILSCLTADQRLQLLFTQNSDGYTALHDAARNGRTQTVRILLDNLTPEQQLQLLPVQNIHGATALHYAAQRGHTESAKTLLDNLTPEQQLKLLSVKNKEGKTASQVSKGYDGTTYMMRTLDHYQKEAHYGVNFRKFAKFS